MLVYVYEKMKNREDVERDVAKSGSGHGHAQSCGVEMQKRGLGLSGACGEDPSSSMDIGWEHRKLMMLVDKGCDRYYKT